MTAAGSRCDRRSPLRVLTTSNRYSVNGIPVELEQIPHENAKRQFGVDVSAMAPFVRACTLCAVRTALDAVYGSVARAGQAKIGSL